MFGNPVAPGARLDDKRGMRAAAALSILAAALAGCRDSGRGLVDEDPAFKVPAIKEAVHDKERKAVPQLVTDLNDDDSAVRFFAIEGLRRLTGQTFDYHYYDDAPARAPAIDRWRAWLAAYKSE